MDIILYNFAKRANSTKEPNPMDSTRKMVSGVQLKGDTSFVNPVLKLSENALGEGFAPVKFNYVSIPYWQRHYFITDWVFNPPFWECKLNIDVLASFKYVIGETSSYIIRSASEFDGNISDAFYPAKTNKVITRQNITSDIYHTTLPSGCYVLGCINNQSTNRMGAVAYYALTDQQMGQVMQFLFSDAIYNSMNIDEIGSDLFKSMFNPFQYIVSCTWFPFPPSTFGSTQTNIKVGYWPLTTNAVMVQYLVAEKTFRSESAIRVHPQISRGEYLNRSPYTRVTAYYPPFGEIEIDTSFMQYGTNNYLYGRLYIDCVTGNADIEMTITDGYDPNTIDSYKVMVQKTSQVGVPIQISQINRDFYGALAGGMTAIGGLATGSGLAAAGGVFGGLLNAIHGAVIPKMSTSGANGSLLEILEPPLLIVESYLITDENRAEFGRPLCQTRKINTLSGFIQCGEADHEFSCTEGERELINSYLKSGFYFE